MQWSVTLMTPLESVSLKILAHFLVWVIACRSKLGFGLFVILVGAFLLGLLCYLLLNTQLNLPSLLALSLIFSGGISNFHDRVFNHGAVIDFLNIGVGSLRTGVFNVADIAIMIGVFMIIIVQGKKDSPALLTTNK